MKREIYKNILYTFLVFIFFSLFTFGVYMSTPALYSSDDPYFHARSAYEIWQGRQVNLPELSSFSDHPVNLYPLYYKLFGPFVSGFTGENFSALIIGSKVFHVIIVGFVFCFFYALCLEIFKNRKYAFASLITLFLLSHIFTFRAILPRPHLISIVFILLAYYAVIKDKKFLLFLSSALFPYFYSASFFILIAPIAAIFYFRKVKYFFLSLLGLSVGIFSRPDFIGYLYNEYYLSLVSVFRKSILNVPGPGELGSYRPIGGGEFSLIIWIAIVLYIIVCHINKKNKIMGENEWFLFIITLPLMLGSVVVQRFLEYLVPFMAIFTVMFFINVFKPWFRKLSYDQLIDNPKNFLDKIKNLYIESVMVFKESPNFFLKSTIFVIIFACIAKTTILMSYSTIQPDPMQYRGVTKYLLDNSKEGERVFFSDFSAHARSYFYDTKNRYIVGLDPVYLYAHDPKLYWLWNSVGSGEKPCDKAFCGPNEYENMHDVLLNSFGSRYIIVDVSSSSPVKRRVLPFKKNLDSDNSFEMVYEDKDFPGMMVYRAK